MSLEALAAVNASVDELSKGDVAAEKIVITPEDISVIMILAIRQSLKLEWKLHQEWTVHC